MGGKNVSQEQGQFDFANIIKKAYEAGINDQNITIQKFIDELKVDMMKLTID